MTKWAVNCGCKLYVIQSIPVSQKTHLSSCFVLWANYSVANSSSTHCAGLLLYYISLCCYWEPDLSQWWRCVSPNLPLICVLGGTRLYLLSWIWVVREKGKTETRRWHSRKKQKENLSLICFACSQLLKHMWNEAALQLGGILHKARVRNELLWSLQGTERQIEFINLGSEGCSGKQAGVWQLVGFSKQSYCCC